MVSENGFRAVAYFVNWAIYGRNHNPQDLIAEKLTHVLYAFANVRPDSGEVYLTDSWSDVEKHYPSDSWNDTGTNIYGCLKQLYILKKTHRNLKILLSIGGWTYSSNFAPAASTPAGGKHFAETAVKILADCGFDGLDVDWEYPQNPKEAEDFVALLRETRRALDEYAKRATPGYHYLLTVACPAGPQNIKNMSIREMDKVLSFWNLMAYDYAGSWDRTAGHQTNVFPSRKNPTATPFSTTAAVEEYVKHGVRRDKIVIGCPLYGRAFVGTDGPGHPFTGGVGEGSWESGVWDWKVLPRAGAHVQTDEETLASWTYDPATKTMVSFDSLDVAKRKAHWITKEGFGGMMWWESSGDRKAEEGACILGVVDTLREKGKMERRENQLNFPESKYENLRKGMP